MEEEAGFLEEMRAAWPSVLTPVSPWLSWGRGSVLGKQRGRGSLRGSSAQWDGVGAPAGAHWPFLLKVSGDCPDDGGGLTPPRGAPGTRLRPPLFQEHRIRPSWPSLCPLGEVLPTSPPEQHSYQGSKSFPKCSFPSSGERAPEGFGLTARPSRSFTGI